MSAKPRTPQSVVERILKDNRMRKRLLAATSVLSLLTVVVTVGVLTFPAISISGTHESLQEQGVNIAENENTVELIAEAADETAQLVANRGEAVASTDLFAAGADASADGVATPIEDATVVTPDISADAAGASGAAGAAGAALAEEDVVSADSSTSAAAENDPEASGETKSGETKQDTPASSTHSASAEHALQEVNLSSKRLIVGADTSEAAAALVADEHAVAAFDGVYLLQYKNEKEAAQGFLDYYDSANFVTPDVAVQIADNVDKENIDPQEEIISTHNIFTEEENPFAELEAALDEAPTQQAEEAAKAHDVLMIALVDTGVASVEAQDATEAQAAARIAANVVDAVSMVGENPRDDNGHGQRMAGYIVEENPAAQILSIKALGKDGTGDVSAVIAGIAYAIERGAHIINLSLCAYASDENAALADAIRRAEEAGVVVVGAAGNQGYNARYYIPGNIEEAFVVGAADETGKRIEASNFGETVDYNVVSAATSEAAARASGILSADALQESMDAAKVFPADFEPEELADGAQDAEDATDAQGAEGADTNAGAEDETSADASDENAVATDEGEAADTSASNAPAAFSGAQAQAGTTQAGASSETRQKLIEQTKSNANADDGAFTSITVSSWDALDWAIKNCKAGEQVIITVSSNLAAYKTIEIPSGKNIKIVAANGAKIYRDSSPASDIGSFFSVSGELNLNGIELNGQAVSATIEEAAPAQYDYTGFAVSEAGAYRSGYWHITVGPHAGGNNYYVQRNDESSGVFTSRQTSLNSYLFQITDGSGRSKYGDGSLDENNFLSGSQYMFISQDDNNSVNGVYLSGSHAGSGNTYRVSDYTNNDVGWAPNLLWQAKDFSDGSTTYKVWYNAANKVYLKRSGNTITVAPVNLGGTGNGTVSLNLGSASETSVADSSFITVNNGGTASLDGATLTKSKSTSENKAPVIVANGGTLNINAGTSIENNSGITAGAIYVSGENAVINMNGGAIKNNKSEVKDKDGNVLDPAYQVTTEDDMLGKDTLQVSAGGIVINGGTVNLKDGTISGNSGHAGAFYIKGNGTLNMTGGQIGKKDEANVGRNAGAGVVEAGTFNMLSGSIEYNDTLQRGTITVLPNGKMNMDVGEGLSAPKIVFNRTTNKGGAIYVDSDNVKLIRGELANNTAGYMGGAIYVVGDNPENTRIMEFGTNPAYKAYIYENTAGTLPGFTTRWGDGRGGGAWFCAWSTVIYDESRVEIADNYLGTQREGGGWDVFKTAGLGLVAEWTKTQLVNGEEKDVDSFTNWRTEDGTGSIFWVKRTDDGWYGEEKLKNSSSISQDVKNSTNALLIHDNQAALGGGLGLNGIITFHEIPVFRKVAWANLKIHKDWTNGTSSIADPADKKVEVTITLKDTSKEDAKVVGTQTFTLENGKTVDGSTGVGTTGDSAGITIGGDELVGGSGAHTGWYASIALPSYIEDVEYTDNGEGASPRYTPQWDQAHTPYEKFTAVAQNDIAITNNGNQKVAAFTLSSEDTSKYALEIAETVYQKRGGAWVALDASSYDLSVDQLTKNNVSTKETSDVSGAVTVKYETFDLSTTLHNTNDARSIVDVQKVDGDGVALEGAKFVLAREKDGKTEYATVDAKGDVTAWVEANTNEAENHAVKASVARTTSESGMLSYAGLEPGAYWIEEIEAPYGYVIDGSGRQDFVIGADLTVHAPGALSYEVGIASNGALSLGGKPLKLEGKQLYLMDLDGVSRTTLDSTWQYLIASIPSASANSDGPNAFTWVQNGVFEYRTLPDENTFVNAYWNDDKGWQHRWKPAQVNGHWVFKNDGLEKNNVDAKYLAIDRDGNIKLVSEDKLIADFDSIVVTNPAARTYPVSVTKTSSEDGSVLPGATFRLTTTDNQGNERFAARGSDDVVAWVDAPGDGTSTDPTIWTSAAGSGQISFTGLKAGTYSLREVAAPAGYVTSTKVLEFTVLDDGTVQSSNGGAHNPGKITLGSGGELYMNENVRVTKAYANYTDEFFLQTYNGASINTIDSVGTGNVYLISTKAIAGGDSWYVGDDGSSGTLANFPGNDGFEQAKANEKLQWVAETVNGQKILRNKGTGRYLIYDASANGSKFRLVDTRPAAELQFANDKVDDTVKPKLTLNKQDENGNPLTGAAFTIALKTTPENTKELTDENNDGTFEFDFAAFGNDYAPDAVFVLKETTPPNGYDKLSKKLEFTIDRAGKITWASGYTPDGNISLATEIVSGAGNGSAEQGSAESVEDANFAPYNNEGSDWGQKGANGQKVTFAPIKDAQGNVIEGAQVTLTRIPAWDTSLRYENAKWINTSSNYELTLIKGEEYILSAVKDGYTIATKQFKVGGSASVNNGDGYVPQQHTTSTTDAQQTVTYLQHQESAGNGGYTPKEVVYSGGVTEQVFCGAREKSSSQSDFRTRTVWNGAGNAWWAGPGTNWPGGYFDSALTAKYSTWLDRVAYLYSYDHWNKDKRANGTFQSSADPQVLTGYALQQAVQRVLYNGYPYNAAGFTNTAQLRQTTQQALYYVLHNGQGYKDGALGLGAAGYRASADNEAMFDALVNYALLGTQSSSWTFQDAPAGTEIYVYWYTQNGAVRALDSQPLIGIYAPVGQEVATTGQLNQTQETPVVTRDVLNVKNNPTPQDYTKPTLTLKKTDASGNTALAGAVFTISEKNGEKTQEITVGADGTVTFDFAGLDLEHAYSPDTIYVLKETQAPDGYVALTSDIEFRIARDGTITFVGNTDDDKVKLEGTLESNTGSTGEHQTGEGQESSNTEDENFTPFNYENTDWGQKGANGQKVTFVPIKDAQGNVIEGAQVTLTRIPAWDASLRYENAKWINTSSNYELTLIKGEEYILSAVKDGYSIEEKHFTVGAETTAPNNGDNYTPKQHATSTTNNQQQVTYRQNGTSELANGWYSPKQVIFSGGTTEEVFCGASAKSASDADYGTRSIWNGAGNAWWAGPGVNWRGDYFDSALTAKYSTWLDRVAYLYSYDHWNKDRSANGTFQSSADPQVLTGYALQQAVQRVLYNGYPYNAAGFENTAALRKTTQEALFYVLRNGQGYKDGKLSLDTSSYRSYAPDQAMFDALVNYALLGTQTKPWNFQEAPAGTEIYVYWYTNGGDVTNLAPQPLIGIYAPFSGQEVTTTGSRVTPSTGDTEKTPYVIRVANEHLGYAEILKVSVDENGTKQPLAGATLQILDSAGNPVAIGKDAEGNNITSWVTDGSAKVISLPPGTYKLHEEAAPNGYGLAADVEFEISSTHTQEAPYKITMEDPRSGEVVIRKMSGGHDLSGATLEIVKAVAGDGGKWQPGTAADRVVLNADAEGEARYQWVSNGQELTVTGLQPGTYFVHEVSAPDDFVRDDEYIQFSVAADGNTASDGSSTSSASVNVVNNSKTVNVVINKQWLDKDNKPTSEPRYKGTLIDLITIEFIRSIENSSAKPYKQEMTITKDAKAEHTSIEIDGKNYEVEDGAWGLTIKGLPYAFVDEGVVKHYTYSIEEKIASGEKQYALAEGATLMPNPTTESGTNSTAYTYTFTLQNKVNAPETYGFTLIKGNDWSKDFKNAIASGSVEDAKQANKQESDGMKLAGAEFTLKDDTPDDHKFAQYHAGNTKGKFLTSGGAWVESEGSAHLVAAADFDGVVQVIEGLYPGEYVLTEVKAPAGYETVESTSGKIWRISVADGGVVSVMNTNTSTGSSTDNLISIYNSNTAGESAHIVGITNVPKTYTLPSTGGAGTVLFMLIALAAFTFVFVRLLRPLRRSV